jgi:GMP synthase-like glutamine amidotransferase
MNTMKVAILQCGEVLKQFGSKTGRRNEMVQDMFDVIDGDFEFENFDCQKDYFPDNVDSYDFYIITGSKAGVYENKRWIQTLIQFVQHLNDKKKKVIGICFGHQVIATACHGMVEKSEKGWGVGIAANRLVSAPEWMTETKNELNFLVSHQDQVTALPENAHVIAESDFCPFFIVQWNDHFLSTQGHPEWTKAYSEASMIKRKGIIPPERIESGLDSLYIEPDNGLFARWIIDFVRH